MTARSPWHLTSLVALACALPAPGQTLQAPYDTDYRVRNIGPPPSAPCSYGGLLVDPNDPNRLLIISRTSLGENATIQAINVDRDACGRITGYQGVASFVQAAPDADSGMFYGPNDVLFYSRYPYNEIVQQKPGSTTPDRIDVVAGRRSIGAINLVPPGYPGAGRLKSIRWPEGHWYDATIAPDGNGTFDIVGETQTATLARHPAAAAYLPLNSPKFSNFGVMVTEFWDNSLGVYDVDANGDAIPASHRLFLTGIEGPVGITVDPVTQDILVLTYTWCNNDKLLVIEGFDSCSNWVSYGDGVGGPGGPPTLTGNACPRIGGRVDFTIRNGPVLAPGALLLGTQRIAFPIFGGHLLNNIDLVVFMATDVTGQLQVGFPISGNPSIAGQSFQFQFAFADATAPEGIAMTDGLEVVYRK